VVVSRGLCKVCCKGHEPTRRLTDSEVVRLELQLLTGKVVPHFIQHFSHSEQLNFLHIRGSCVGGGGFQGRPALVLLNNRVHTKTLDQNTCINYHSTKTIFTHSGGKGNRRREKGRREGRGSRLRHGRKEGRKEGRKGRKGRKKRKGEEERETTWPYEERKKHFKNNHRVCVSAIVVVVVVVAVVAVVVAESVYVRVKG